MTNIACIGCGCPARLDRETFHCSNCTLSFSLSSSYFLDYSSTYSDESSLYSEHLKSLDYFQRVKSIKPYLLPFESRILDFISAINSAIKLVDIGCGVGRFLRGAQEQLGSMNVSAYEVADVLVQSLRAYGLNVQKGDLQKFLESEQVFDAITLLEVIEHLQHPGELVKKIFLFKKPAYLIIAVPASCSRRPYDRNFSEHDRPPNHLSWWNHLSLERLMTQDGYRVNIIPIAERRKSLIGHYLRNKDWCHIRNIRLLLKGLISPPIFWYLGIAERI